jgi:hypothetical protein
MSPPQLDARSRLEDMPWQLAHAALWQQVLWLMRLREAHPVAASHTHAQEVRVRWADNAIWK